MRSENNKPKIKKGTRWPKYKRNWEGPLMKKNCKENLFRATHLKLFPPYNFCCWHLCLESTVFWEILANNDFNQCCGSGSPWIHVKQKGRIRIRIINNLDPDPDPHNLQITNQNVRNSIWAFILGARIRTRIRIHIKVTGRIRIRMRNQRDKQDPDQHPHQSAADLQHWFQ